MSAILADADLSPKAFQSIAKATPLETDLPNNLVGFLWKLLSFQNVLEFDFELLSLELPILKSFLDRKYLSLDTFRASQFAH